MIVLHVKISTERLQEVLSRASITSSTNGSGSSSRSGGRRTEGVVSEAVLAATRDIHCRCEDAQHMATIARHVGGTHLHAGMPIRGPSSLVGPDGLGAGCTHPNYVCQRLIKVRARYGW
jgi:hypothetical protein